MAKPSRAEVERLAESVSMLVGQGLDVVTAYSQARIAAASPQKALAVLERERAAAEDKHRNALGKHRRRIERRHRQAVTYGATSIATGVLGVVVWLPTQATAGAALLGASAVTFVLSVRSRWDARHASAPPERPLPALALAAQASTVRAEAIGWRETTQLVAVRRQVVAVLPAVSQLHPGAGRELQAAEDEAGPVMSNLVTRLGLLDQIRRDLPGTVAASAAATSATEVAARLGDGVTHYETLLAAATRLLAAPDVRATYDVLGPAADALTAYAHGLRIAAI